MTEREKRHGNQVPRYKWEPPWAGYDRSDGPVASQLMHEYGLGTYLPWQDEVINEWLRYDVDTGEYINLECGLPAGRRGGKTHIIKGRILYGAMVRHEKILYTAHNELLVNELFEWFKNMCQEDTHPEIWRELTENQHGRKIGVKTGNGKREIHFKGGGYIKFAVRSKGLGRGVDFNVLILDESHALTDAHMDAVDAAILAVEGNVQVIYAGSPPTPQDPGVVFRRVREKLLTKQNPRGCWHQWGLDKLKNDSYADTVADVDLWYDCIPSLGYTITVERLKMAEGSLSDDGFCREILGYWDDFAITGVDPIIPPKAWDQLADPAHEPPAVLGKVTMGIRFSADGHYVAIAACETPRKTKKNKDPVPHIELCCYRNVANAGVTWIADMIWENRRKVAQFAIDGLSNADSLIQQLQDYKVPEACYKRVNATEAATAAQMVFHGVTEHSFTHLGDPAMRQCVKTTEKQANRSGQWWFSGEKPEPLQAAALALWANRTCKRDPRRRQRFR